MILAARLADEQQARRVARPCERGAVDAGRNGVAGVLYGDAPKMEEAEADRLRMWERGVVEVVAVLLQVALEFLVIRSAILAQERGSGRGIIDAAKGIFVADQLAGSAVVGAEPGLRRHRRAIGVEGVDVGGDVAALIIVRVGVDEIQLGREAALSKQREIREDVVAGELAGGAQRKVSETLCIDWLDVFAELRVPDDFTEVALELAGPAVGVHTILEGPCDQLGKAGDHAHPRVICGRGR
jgi:hypothetical protein